MPLRVCHLLHSTVESLPPLRNELRSMAERGWPALVLELAHGPQAQAPALTGIERRPLRIGLRALSTRQSPPLKLLRYMEFFARAFVAILRCRAPIVVAHDLSALPPAWLAARLAGGRIVYHAHELFGESGEGVAPLQRWWRALDRFLCRRADAMIVPEAHRARIYLEEYGARSLPVVVPNVPFRRTPRASDRLPRWLAEQGIASSCIVLYQGLIDPSRNLHLLVDAMALTAEEAVLVLLGGGGAAYAEALTRRIAGHGLQRRVLLHPRVPYDEVAAFTDSAHVGVLLYRNDSRNNYYCAPNKLYEYLQAGLPVITSRFPGLVALVEERRLGRCVDPEQTVEIAAAISELSDPALRRELSERCRRAADEEFHWDAVCGTLFALYERLERRGLH
jgi:glycosyltransferase involved in cell wall biosynthesis